MAFDFTDNKPNKSNGSGTDYSSTIEAVPRSSATSLGTVSKSSGFQDRPERKKDTGTLVPSRQISSDSNERRWQGKERKSTTRRTYSPVNEFHIPWNIILPLIGIVVIVAFCWIYREAITDFLMQVLNWIFIILLIIFLIKWFIFPRRRR